MRLITTLLESNMGRIILALLLVATMIVAVGIFTYNKHMPGKEIRKAVESSYEKASTLIHTGVKSAPQELIDAMKELEAEAKTLRKQNEALRLENIALQRRIDSLEELGKVGGAVQEDLKILKSLISKEKMDQVKTK